MEAFQAPLTVAFLHLWLRIADIGSGILSRDGVGGRVARTTPINYGQDQP